MKQYILIPYPDYTFYQMDEWFDSEAIPLDDEKIISQIGMCMFIPKDRVEAEGNPYIYHLLGNPEKEIYRNHAIKGEGETFFLSQDKFQELWFVE